jgi:predicted kinase
MSKLILMKGLPGSGKSTRAEEILRANGNAVRLNKDLLRTMLHFDKWSGRNEGITRNAEHALARFFLGESKTVIIDDTNLNEGTLQGWKELAAKMEGVNLEYIYLNTPMEECIKRDAMREKRVGADVIKQMALQSGMYPKPVRGFVLCDLDGTLCDISHRLHFVKPGKLVEVSTMTDGTIEPGFKKDWKGFFDAIPDDKPRTEVVDMLLGYEDDGYEIIFVSARPDTYRNVTEEWFDKAFNGYQIHKTLIMRKATDKRDDVDVKQQIYDVYFKKHGYHVHAVIDDRPKVIRMWRANGLDVIDVGSGVEF